MDEIAIMNLVVNSGNARSLALEAFRDARAGKFEDAEAKLKDVLGDDMRTTADIADAEYEWIGFVEDAAEYLLYDDDGISKNCNLEENCKKITVRREDLA